MAETGDLSGLNQQLKDLKTEVAKGNAEARATATDAERAAAEAANAYDDMMREAQAENQARKSGKPQLVTVKGSVSVPEVANEIKDSWLKQYKARQDAVDKQKTYF